MASQQKQGHKSLFNRLVEYIDHTQQKHPALAFPYAVIKKYSDDEAGHQAALLTYYGFLSLFPLLLVATSVIDLIARRDSDLHTRLLDSISTHFPIIGDQLQSQVSTSGKTGIALVIGLLVALYGIRGIANAVRGMLDHAWTTPKARRSGFLKGTLKSTTLLLGGGLGLILSTTLASYATAALDAHSPLTRIMPIVVSLVLLYLLLLYVFAVGPSQRRPRRDVRLGAAIASVALLVLQTVGGYLLTHRLHELRGFYGQFALVLTILFWLYLQSQVLVYATEINAVHARRLWPRSSSGRFLTSADRKAYRLYARERAYRPEDEETIQVNFNPRS